MVSRISSSEHALGAAAQTKLRILQRGGVRAAIRLEVIFWSQLEDIAKDEKQPLSQLVFGIFSASRAKGNRTALLRCFCLDRLRRKSGLAKISVESFDLLALIAACPAASAVITKERKIAAFNAEFGRLLNDLHKGAPEARAIQLSFSEPISKIQRRLLDRPHEITHYQIGIQHGGGAARYFMARFAIVDRSIGTNSYMVVFIEGSLRAANPL